MAKRHTDTMRWWVNVFRAAERLGVEQFDDSALPKLKRLYDAGRTAAQAALIMWGDPAAPAASDTPQLPLGDTDHD